MQKNLVNSKKSSTFAVAFEMKQGAIAQLVEQRTENPCVPSSILGGTTKRGLTASFLCIFYAKRWNICVHLAYMQILLYLCAIIQNTCIDEKVLCSLFANRAPDRLFPKRVPPIG